MVVWFVMILSGIVWASDVCGRLLVLESKAHDAEAVKADILRQVPPSWLKEDIQEIKERLRSLEAKIK